MESAMKSVARWVSAVVVVLGAGVALTGCESAKTVADDSRKYYEAGQYQEAYDVSHGIADNLSRPIPEREQAGYMAGISAVKLKRYDEGRHYLEIPADSKDVSLSGNAEAQLGLLFALTEKWDLSSEHLLKATGKLEGQEKANAYFHAAIAEQRVGRWPQARTNFSLAKSLSSDAGFRARVDEQLRMTGYTLQLGAFTKEDGARKAADRIALLPAAKKLGKPKIVAAKDPETGGVLYLVQMGEFISFPTAQQAREDLNLNNAIIAPMFVKK